MEEKYCDRKYIKRMKRKQREETKIGQLLQKRERGTKVMLRPNRETRSLTNNPKFLSTKPTMPKLKSSPHRHRILSCRGTNTSPHHKHLTPLITPLFKNISSQKRSHQQQKYFATFPHILHYGISAPDIDKKILPEILRITSEFEQWGDVALAKSSHYFLHDDADSSQSSQQQQEDSAKEVSNSDASLDLDQKHMQFYTYLMRSNYSEQKRAAVASFKWIITKRGKKRNAWVHRLQDDAVAEAVLLWMRTIEDEVLEHQAVSDWAACDSLCSVIGVLLAKDWDKREDAMELLKSWSFGVASPKVLKQSQNNPQTPSVDNAERNLWLQRMACVALLRAAKSKKYHDDIFTIVEEVIKNSERFAQLGAGWVLREVSAVDEASTERVIKFLKKTYSHWIREGWRYAIEKLNKNMRQEMLKYRPGDDDDTESRHSSTEEPPRKRRKTEKTGVSQVQMA